MAIAKGEASGQAFAVLSPRGYEVYVQAAPEPELITVLVETLEVGQTVVGTRKQDPIRVVGRVSLGKKHITVWDQEGRDFGWWPRGAETQVVGWSSPRLPTSPAGTYLPGSRASRAMRQFARIVTTLLYLGHEPRHGRTPNAGVQLIDQKGFVMSRYRTC